MAYPGDFVAANRAARTDPQHAAIHLCKKRRVFLCFDPVGFAIFAIPQRKGGPITCAPAVSPPGSSNQQQHCHLIGEVWCSSRVAR